MEVVHWHEEVVKVSELLFEGSGVTESSLVVRHGPLGGAHHSQVVVQVGVDAPEQGVLGGEVLLGH